MSEKSTGVWFFTVAIPVAAACAAIFTVASLGLRFGVDLLTSDVAAILGEDSWLYLTVKILAVATLFSGVVFIGGKALMSLAPPIKKLSESIESKPALTWAVILGLLATPFGDSLADLIGDNGPELLKGLTKFGTGIIFIAAAYFFNKPSWSFKLLGLFLWLGLPVLFYAIASSFSFRLPQGIEDPSDQRMAWYFLIAWLLLAGIVALVTYKNQPRGARPSAPPNPAAEPGGFAAG